MAQQVEAFVGPIIPGGVSGAAKRAAVSAALNADPSKAAAFAMQHGGKAGKVIGKGIEMYSNLTGAQKDAITQTGSNMVKSVAKNVTAKGTKSRGGGGSMKGDSNRGHSSGYALTKAPNPKQVKLDTGIFPNTYVSDFMQAVNGSCVPLSMTSVQFKFPTTVSNLLYTYFQNIIAFDLQTKAQVNVTFNLDVTTVFTADNIRKAFNDLVYALQVYFYYASIISYHSDPTNRNMGMLYLRTQMTPQVIEDLRNLERRLLDTPVPPRLLEYLRYLSGNYYSGDTAGSPLIKLCPFKPSSTMLDLTAPAAAFQALNGVVNTNNNAVFTLLRRCVPQWSPGVLYDVEPAPLYDRNFKTIFANLPIYTYSNATVKPWPQVTTSSAVYAYNSFTDTLDGAAFALTGAYNTTASDWIPGLIIPIQATSGTTTALNTRWSYYTDATNTAYQFYPADPDLTITRSRQETYVPNDTNSNMYGIHLSGANLCQTVNADTVRETCYKVTDYLMSLDLIKVDARNFHFGKSNNNFGGPKSKSKGDKRK